MPDRRSVIAATRTHPLTSLTAVIALLGNVVRGFLMGAADVVPGVSGGTVGPGMGGTRPGWATGALTAACCGKFPGV